jgi:hypothetical protein
MIGLIVKSVGIAKATVIIGLINLTYILFRYEQVVRLNIVFFYALQAVIEEQESKFSLVTVSNNL